MTFSEWSVEPTFSFTKTSKRDKMSMSKRMKMKHNTSTYNFSEILCQNKRSLLHNTAQKREDTIFAPCIPSQTSCDCRQLFYCTTPSFITNIQSLSSNRAWGSWADATNINHGPLVNHSTITIDSEAENCGIAHNVLWHFRHVDIVIFIKKRTSNRKME